MKVVFATLLLVSLLLLSSTFLEIVTADYSSICENKCVVRCSVAGEQKRCMKYCGMCCEECDACVPSGTSGNKWECPCYQNKLNSKGGSKCP